MKVSRWKIIYAIFGEIIASLFSKMMLPVILYAIIMDINKIIQVRGNVDIIDIMGFILLLIGAFLLIGALWGKGYLLDIILMNVQETSLLPASELEYGDVIPGFAWSFIGYDLIVGKDRNNPLRLQVFHKLVTKPVADYYKIYYLKYTKTVIGFEAVGLQEKTTKTWVQIKNERKRKRSKKAVEASKETFSIPKYDTNTLWNMTKHHAWRPALWIMYNVVAFVGMESYLLYVVGKCGNGHVITSRELSGIIMLAGLEIACLVVYIKGFKGYFLDILSRKVSATTVLPFETIKSKKCIYDMHGKVIGLILLLDVGTEQPQRLIVYNNVSQYWNGFEMHPRYSHRHVRYLPDDYNICSVRFYYLKSSKIVVKMDVKHKIL